MNANDATAYHPGKGRKLAMIAGLGVMGFAGFAVAMLATPGNIVQSRLAAAPAPITHTPSAAPAAGPLVSWVAAAPGRVEPRSGQIRISAAIAGRVVLVAVRANDKVAVDEVLMRLDDREPRARLTAAEAETAARKRERDAQPATSGREAVTKAEDAVFAAERAVTNARFELDDMIAADRKGSAGSPVNLSQARRRLADAQDRLRHETLAFASAQARGNIPAPSRLDAAVAASRAEVTQAEIMLERTRIRAPIAGTVLQINAKVGEMVAPGEMPLVVMGDLSLMRVRAEVDEQDVAKIKVGQRVFVRNNAYPGQEFEGKVAELAPSLATPRMGSRGVRRATDVEVMEVVIDLDGNVPLLAGMRADAFFRR